MSGLVKINKDLRYTQDRELSWLRFNERVLEEASDESVPLIERLKFVAIFSSNLDEFFMIRVGSLLDMTLLDETHIDNKSGKTPKEQLHDIFEAVVPLYKTRHKVLEALENECRACNICRLSFNELGGKALKQVDNWFRNEVRPILSPQIVDLHHPFPHLPNKQLSIVLNLKSEDKDMLGIITIPPTLPPILRLDKRGVSYIMTEDVLMEYADEIFDNFTVTDKAVISVTRNADISPEDEAYDVDMDFRRHMQKIVKKRTRLAPVRLEICGAKSKKLGELIRTRLKLSKEQVFYLKSPIRQSYLFSISDMLPKESAATLCYPPYEPRLSPSINLNEKIIPQVMHQDVLLFYPYESMKPFLEMLREAASDPNVLSIKITIYRLAQHARLAEYLCAAAENGKQVTILMELRARFDEQNNIKWAERFEEAGCTILYGFEGIKVHSKVCLITRREHGRVSYITQIGTGNYNEKTAKQYTDLCLMTGNPEIGRDAALFFQNMATSNLSGGYSRLAVSPFALRDRVMECIDREIEKGENGGYIFLKLNSLTDRKLIDKLAEASRAGVEVVMNIRGICCLLPGIEGLTENIKVFSIVGRYLEHTRIYCFGRGAQSRLYISSADFMTRNTERRVEVACPIYDLKIRERIFHIIDILCRDNVKSRVMLSDGTYMRNTDGRAPLSCQEIFARETYERVVPKDGFFERLKQMFKDYFG